MSMEDQGNHQPEDLSQVVKAVFRAQDPEALGFTAREKLLGIMKSLDPTLVEKEADLHSLMDKCATGPGNTICVDDFIDSFWGDGKVADTIGDKPIVDHGLRALRGGADLEMFSSIASIKGKQFIKDTAPTATPTSLVYDPFAWSTLTYDTWRMFEKYLANGLLRNSAKGLILGYCTGFIDMQIKQAVSNGAKQIVYVGCGLDHRCMRLFFAGVPSFEIEKAGVIRYKIKQLAMIGFTSYPSTLVSGDYLSMDVAAALQEKGMDLFAPTVFVWEGNSMCISAEATQAFLKSIFDRVPQASIVFDSVGPGAVETIGGNTILDIGAVAAAAGARVQSSVSLGSFVDSMKEFVDPATVFAADPDGMEVFRKAAAFTFFNVLTK